MITTHAEGVTYPSRREQTILENELAAWQRYAAENPGDGRARQKVRERETKLAACPWRPR